MKLQWIGGPTFILELGHFRVLADPVLGETVLDSPRRAPVPAIDDSAFDRVVISRNRPDHVDAAAAQHVADAMVITPKAGADWLGEIGFKTFTAVRWWDEVTMSKSDEQLTVTSVPTHAKENQESHGFLFKHKVGDQERNVYWTGDTLWFSGAREIKSRYDKLDLLVPVMGAVGEGQPGGVSTLSGKQAMQFVFMSQPKRVVPVGYNTFTHYTEGVGDFRERIEVTMYDRRLVVLGEGETFER